MRRFFAFLKKVTFHPNPKTRLKITLVYCGIGLFANFFMLQVFCMPVMYAAVMCIAFFVAILIFPFVQAPWVKNVLYFLLGMGVPICLYCILFLSDSYSFPYSYLGYLLAILFFGVGLLAFIPFYLLRHIYIYHKGAGKYGKRILKAGIFAPILALIIYIFCFHLYLTKVEIIYRHSASKDEFVSSLPANYFTERILGLQWKYHTCLEFIYDGWRPPLHDPFLILGGVLGAPTYFHNFNEPNLWPTYNNEAIKYYHRKFPERPLKEWCPCSYSHDGKGYLSDPLDSTVGVRH